MRLSSEGSLLQVSSQAIGSPKDKEVGGPSSTQDLSSVIKIIKAEVVATMETCLYIIT